MLFGDIPDMFVPSTAPSGKVESGQRRVEAKVFEYKFQWRWVYTQATLTIRTVTMGTYTTINSD